MFRKKLTFSSLAKSISIIIALVLIWRGVWHILDKLDEWFFGGSHEWTALAGVIIGLIILYIHDSDEIKKA